MAHCQNQLVSQCNWLEISTGLPNIISQSSSTCIQSAIIFIPFESNSWQSYIISFQSGSSYMIQIITWFHMTHPCNRVYHLAVPYDQAKNHFEREFQIQSWSLVYSFQSFTDQTSYSTSTIINWRLKIPADQYSTTIKHNWTLNIKNELHMISTWYKHNQSLNETELSKTRPSSGYSSTHPLSQTCLLARNEGEMKPKSNLISFNRRRRGLPFLILFLHVLHPDQLIKLHTPLHKTVSQIFWSRIQLINNSI